VIVVGITMASLERTANRLTKVLFAFLKIPADSGEARAKTEGDGPEGN
jgi:hypothetical protein